MGQGPGTKRLNAQRKARGKDNGRRWVKLRIAGWSNRDIANHFGVSDSTVSERITKELDRPVEGVDQLRTLEMGKLDEREKRIKKVMAEHLDDPESVAKLDRRLQEIGERRAKLCGLDTPVKVDPDLVVSTSAATAAATVAAVNEVRAVPAVQIILSSEVPKPE